MLQLQQSVSDLQCEKGDSGNTSEYIEYTDAILLKNELSNELAATKSLLEAKNNECTLLLEKLSCVSTGNNKNVTELQHLQQLVEFLTEEKENILKNEKMLAESNTVLQKDSAFLRVALDESLQVQKELSSRLEAETELNNRAANEIQRLKIEIARLDGDLSEAGSSRSQSNYMGELRAAKIQLQK